MARATRATIHAGGYSIVGTYHGGAYIDLSLDGGRSAFDVINVWDYAADRPTIPNTAAAVRAAMRDWRDAAGDSLAHDMAEYALVMRGVG